VLHPLQPPAPARRRHPGHRLLLIVLLLVRSLLVFWHSNPLLALVSVAREEALLDDPAQWVTSRGSSVPINPPLGGTADLELLTIRAERVELPLAFMVHRPSGGTADREATTLGALQQVAPGRTRLLESTGKPLRTAAKSGPAPAFVH
jgi:hypothetical protein